MEVYQQFFFFFFKQNDLLCFWLLRVDWTSINFWTFSDQKIYIFLCDISLSRLQVGNPISDAIFLRRNVNFGYYGQFSHRSAKEGIPPESLKNSLPKRCWSNEEYFSWQRLGRCFYKFSEKGLPIKTLKNGFPWKR